MDCIEAQSTISAALDRSPVDGAILEEVKAHCKTCPNCGAFVRALSAAKRSPLPEPPEDLPDRIMAAVRAEAQSNLLSHRTAAEKTTASEEAAASTPASRPEGIATRGLALILAPTSRRQLLIWGSAAAVLLVLAGVATVNGVRQITGVDSSTSNMLAVGSAGSAGGPSSASPEVAGDAAKTATGPAADAGATPGSGTSNHTASSFSFVTISGTVYRLSGPATVTKDQLKQIGTANTTMATNGQPKDRTVFAGADPARVFLEDDAGKLYAFDRVVRVFRSITYQQQASAIPLFGTWPSLPAQITAPASADGSPIFVEEGTDGAGVKIYRLAVSSASLGIGVAPGTAAGDPAAGNPNWTWWAPIR